MSLSMSSLTGRSSSESTTLAISYGSESFIISTLLEAGIPSPN
jgi:hypothetical protein